MSSSSQIPIEDLLGVTVLDGKKHPVPVSSISRKVKVLGLYFSAHWCPPCRRFTPALAEFYLKLKSSQPNAFEVVFISSDQDESQWAAYFAEMPWLALPFTARARKEAIEEILENPDGKGFPWRK